MDDGFAHITSVHSSCMPEKAFARLSDLSQLTDWNFNLKEIQMMGENLARGVLKLNGESILIRLSMDHEMRILHFHLGNSMDSMIPRIMIRVLSHSFQGESTTGCVITMIAWKVAGMDEERWRGLKAAHEYEILQIKAILESKEC